ncbi:FAD-dependent monooxygenase [Brevibacterium oceani]|uniref:FAD-dependent monooxygenase n=1 Tax=Brevibacterium oceani TaxID=358099 RepID=UPI001B32C74A|nr:FAD-dependent monooxygenase [Brevibacterium oceani]
MAQNILPVLIVGGGPVGLCAALELDSHGVPVTIVEPRVLIDHSRPRAKTTSARTMEHFRRWGISGRVREAASLPVDWSQRVTFVETLSGKEVAHLDGCLGLSVPDEVSPEKAQQISQGRVEEVLRSAVSEREGITTLYGWEVTRLEEQREHVVVTIRDQNGRDTPLTTSWVVGADGPRSAVRAAMGTRYAGASGGRPNVNITFRSRELADKIRHPPSLQYWVLDPSCPGVVGPLDLDGTWWAISTGTESVSDDVEARRIIQGLVGSDIDIEIVATDPWQARMLIAQEYRRGRLFVVGDAAHQNPPWGGHGFNTGVGDAVNIGWKLAAVINGWAPEHLLDSYAAERKPVAAQTIALAQSNMKALSNDLSDGLLEDSSTAMANHAARIRELKSPEFYADGLVFGYGYGDSAAKQTPTLAEYRPIATAGNRMPHRRRQGRALFDVLGREFTVIGPASHASALVQDARRRCIPLSHMAAAGDLILVRPDQHIAWVGQTVDDPERILDDALTGFVQSVPRPRRFT